MKRMILAIFLLVGVAACTGSKPPPPPPPQNAVVVPGGEYSLLSIARSALKCPEGTITWSVVEPTGGAVDQAGNYRAPSCGDAGYSQGTYTVRASGCSQTVDIPVTVAEDVLSVVVSCGVVQGTDCCAAMPIAVSPGQQVQFYARVNYTCSFIDHPAAPPVTCP